MTNPQQENDSEAWIATLESNLQTAIAQEDKEEIGRRAKALAEVAGEFCTDIDPQRIWSHIERIPEGYWDRVHLTSVFQFLEKPPQIMLDRLKNVLRRWFEYTLDGHPHYVQQILGEVKSGFRGGFLDDMKPEANGILGDLIVEYLEAARKNELEKLKEARAHEDLIAERKRENLDLAIKWAAGFYNEISIGNSSNKPDEPINQKILEKLGVLVDARLEIFPDTIQKVTCLLDVGAKTKWQYVSDMLCPKIDALIKASPDDATRLPLYEAILAHPGPDSGFHPALQALHEKADQFIHPGGHPEAAALWKKILDTETPKTSDPPPADAPSPSGPQ